MKVQFFNKFLPAFSVFAICLFAVSQADAQKKRRAKRSVPQPVVTATTSSTLVVPEVVRRADENEVETTSFPATDETSTTGATAQTDDAETLRLKIDELTEKLRAVESGNSKEADALEKKLLLNLDILTKAEQRTESLRKQLYDLVEKENAVKTKVEQLNYEMRPEMIDRNVAFSGSLRPEDVRDARQKSLQSEKNNLQNLLTQITANREKLEVSVQRAEMLVDKIRLKFEKEIDDSLTDPTQPQD